MIFLFKNIKIRIYTAGHSAAENFENSLPDSFSGRNSHRTSCRACRRNSAEQPQTQRQKKLDKGTRHMYNIHVVGMKGNGVMVTRGSPKPLLRVRVLLALLGRSPMRTLVLKGLFIFLFQVQTNMLFLSEQSGKHIADHIRKVVGQR